MRKTYPYIDLHCHPTLKPFGRSFNLKKERWGQQSSKRFSRTSLWCGDTVKRYQADRLLNFVLSLTKFIQTNFKTVARSEGRILVIAIGPMEKGLVINNLGRKIVVDKLSNLATGIGEGRINFLQRMDDYFKDLEMEMKFLQQQQGNKVLFKLNQRGNQKEEEFTYKLISSYKEFNKDDKNTIHVVITFEGAHVFNTGLKLAGKPAANSDDVLANIKRVKNDKDLWKIKPFFVTLGHHFPNEICGHHKTFPKSFDSIYNQEIEPDQGITDLGWKVINELISDSNGKRILIDIKHMNAKSRYQYYKHIEKLNDGTENKIPLIYSHGSFNRINSPDELKFASNTYIQSEINLFDDEILRIYESGGIIGLQLDKRRLMTDNERKGFLKKVVMAFKTNSKLRNESYKYVWRNIEYLALYLNSKNRFAWGTLSIGSDFDGIINPLNGFWTAYELPYLRTRLLNRARKFISSNKAKDLIEINRIAAEEIIDRFFYKNANSFLKENLK